jgi:hypothetical protein
MNSSPHILLLAPVVTPLERVQGKAKLDWQSTLLAQA